MTDEQDFEPLADEIEVADTEQAFDVVQTTFDTFLESATVDAAYGNPIESGDTLIIPTAEVLSIVGFGVGSGYGSGASSDEQGGMGSGGGGGGGGGGRVLSRPVAVVIASPQGVRVEPVFDVTKIALAALTAGGFMAAMILRMLSPRRALRELKE